MGTRGSERNRRRYPDGKVDSRRLNRASDIEKYFATLPPELQPGPDTMVATPKAFTDINLVGSRTKPPQKAAGQDEASAEDAKDTGAEDTPVHTSISTKLEMLVREAGTLDAGRFPLSCAFVLRAIVELAVNAT